MLSMFYVVTPNQQYKCIILPSLMQLIPLETSGYRPFSVLLNINVTEVNAMEKLFAKRHLPFTDPPINDNCKTSFQSQKQPLLALFLIKLKDKNRFCDPVQL